MNPEQQIKGTDKKYCESCGPLIKIKAGICPYGGDPSTAGRHPAHFMPVMVAKKSYSYL